ncbi:MAG TPA: alpha/beta hydrolase [Thermoanaerobaculia bacterium]|nr:alpha/beta hydrolase [Thermoanaerobaculia bacterium]
MRTSATVPLLALLLVPSASFANGSTALQLTPCTPPGMAAEARCGTYEVFENRAAKSGRKLPLSVVVLPATGAAREPDPLVYFSGGPGESAIDSASWLAHTLADLRQRRDIVLVDLRGTGKSAPLFCSAMTGTRGIEGFLEHFLPVDEVRACRREHADRDLAWYNSPVAMDDVAEVLTALGYERANLMGGSYGTRSALTFIRRHPQRARTAVLHAVVTPDSGYPATVASDAQAALDGTLAECAADSACAKAFPRTREELAAVFERLAKAPVTVELRHPNTGEPLSLRLSRAGFAQGLRYMLYSPSAAVLVPLYVHAAFEGDYRPMAELVAKQAAMVSGNQLSDGFYLSVTCAEDVPFIDDAAATAAARGTFLGDFRLRAQQAACREWGVPPLPREVLEPVRSDVPALLVSGERDPVTPPRDGHAVARHLTRALHVVIPDAGHSLEGMKGAECVDRLAVQLVEKGSVEGLDTSCLAAIQRPAFVLELPRDVALEPARLAALAGTYAAPDGAIELRVELAGDRLRVFFLEETFFLVPVSATRFRVEGLPPAYGLEVVESGGKVTGMKLLEGETVIELARKG